MAEEKPKPEGGGWRRNRLVLNPPGRCSASGLTVLPRSDRERGLRRRAWKPRRSQR